MPTDKKALWTLSFTLIFVAHLMMTVGFYATMPVYSLFLEDRFHLEGLVLGVAVACYTATAILARLPAGYCLDKYGRRRIYLGSYLGFGLVYFLYPLAGDVVTVSLARVLHGALWGVTMGAATTAVVDVLPPLRRGEGIGYFGLAMILGMSGGPALGTIVAETFGYNPLFVGVGILTLAGFGVLTLVRFPDVPRTVRPFSPDALLEKSSLPASLATLVFCIPYGVIMNYTGTIARGIPGASAGAFFLMLALGTALSRLRAGAVFDRSGPGGVMVPGYLFLISGYAVLSCAGGAVPFMLGALLLGLGYGTAVPVMQALVNAIVPPERRGAANATFMTAFDLGICIGLLSMSHIAVRYGWSATYAVLAGCGLVSALIFRYATLPHYRAARASSRTDG